MNLVFLFEASLLHALLKLGQVSDQFCFVCLSNGSVLFLTAFTAAENVDDISVLLALDLNTRLFLKWIPRRGCSQDFLPSIVVLQLIEPMVSLRLQSGHQV